MNSDLTLIHCAGILDGNAVAAAPGALLLRGHVVIDAGDPESIGVPAGATLIKRNDAVLIPALVNAHAHLDLSHIGTISCEGTFSQWIDGVRNKRATEPHAIRCAVALGAELAHAGGTALIADIAGVRSLDAVEALRKSRLGGVSFLEVFGLQSRASETCTFLSTVTDTIPEQEGNVRLGLQPHAPYSCNRAVYEAAADRNLPLSTHLAETPEEIEFIRTGTGPIADMLTRLGLPPEDFHPHGTHPIDHLAPILESTRIICAHVNHVDDEHLDAMRGWPVTIAYCPRASAYFHPRSKADALPVHRYREMIDAGLNVALGTDSILCLDTSERISVLDDIRLLFQRDGSDPQALLRLATINGARALGAKESLFTFAPGRVAGILAVPIDSVARNDPITEALRNSSSPEWIIEPDITDWMA